MICKLGAVCHFNLRYKSLVFKISHFARNEVTELVMVNDKPFRITIVFQKNRWSQTFEVFKTSKVSSQNIYLEYYIY